MGDLLVVGSHDSRSVATGKKDYQFRVSASSFSIEFQHRSKTAVPNCF